MLSKVASWIVSTSNVTHEVSTPSDIELSGSEVGDEEWLYVEVDGCQLPRPSPLPPSFKSLHYPALFDRTKLDSKLKLNHRIPGISTCCWIIPDCVAFGQYPWTFDIVNRWKQNDEGIMNFDSYQPITEMDTLCYNLVASFDVFVNVAADIEQLQIYPYDEVLNKYKKRRSASVHVIDLPITDLEDFEAKVGTLLEELLPLIKTKHARVLIHDGNNNSGYPAMIAGLLFSKLYRDKVNKEFIWHRLQAASTARIVNNELCMNVSQHVLFHNLLHAE